MDSEEIEKVAETTAPTTSGAANSFLLKERFEILFNTPLAEHNTNGAIAYKVNDKINPKRNLFALICSNQTAPRLSHLPYIKSIEHSNIMSLIEYGTAICPPNNSRNLALIYQVPGGPRITNLSTLPPLRKSGEKFKHLMFSMLNALEVLKGHSIVHRAIRADNLYFKDESCTELVLGDCLASFPAFYQPAAYETVESLMADKEGRGNGNYSEDIYAAGVVGLTMIYQKELMSGLTIPEALRAKLRKGSYSALTSEDKMPNTYVNFFKGILSDNLESRWDYVQAYNFLEGKPNTFAMPLPPETPKKSLIMNNEKYYTPAGVVLAIENSPQEAIDVIKGGKLLDWIRSGLENERLYLQIERLIKQEANTLPPAVLIAKVCILLNPDAPIRINNISAFPSGIAKAIFYAIKNQSPLNPFHDFFAYDLIKLWYNEQASSRSPSNAAEFKTYINRRDYGYGIERIMYDFDNDLPCISPLLGDEFVISAPQILKALDNNYGNKKISTAPFDRTIIAYLRCKLGKRIDGLLSELNSGKQQTQIAALLHIYSDIQQRYGPAQVPNLAQWIITYSLPVVKSFHNIKYQKILEREIIKSAKLGQLIAIYSILENDEAKSADMRQYAQALKEANTLVTTKNRITAGGTQLDEEARDAALHFATILAVLTMAASFVINLISWMLTQ